MSGAQCAPAFLAGAPSCRYWCVCGVELWPVRMGPTVNDWAYQDAQGQRRAWRGPASHPDDPYGYLEHVRSLFYDERTRKCLTGPRADWAACEYSSLSAMLSLGGSLWHHHRVDTNRTERLSDDPWKCPECCGSPMWASPDGWACRVQGTLFAYLEA